MTLTIAFTLEIALEFVEQTVFQHIGKHLKDIERIFFQEVWQGKTYKQIAYETDYEIDYINCDVAFYLWQKLTEALGEKVKKSNFKGVLERHWQSQGKIGLPARPSTHSYIERPPLEAELCQELLKPGALIRIKAPQKMGKTKLLDQLLDYGANQQQYLTVPFNVMGLTNAVAQDINLFLKTFCHHVTRKLKLENQMDEFWDMGLGPNSTCTDYFDEYILGEIEQPIILALDNVDRLFPYQAVADDFFCMLRSWHEDAKKYKHWQQIRLIIVHSTEVYIPLSVNHSPFNVGLAKELPEWNREQVKQLAQGSGLLIPPARLDTEITALMEMVGGHPHLVQTAFQYLRFQPQTSLSELMKMAPTDAGIYEDHLRDLLGQLQASPELLETMQAVVQAQAPISIQSKHRFLLNRLGLVVYHGNEVQPRNQLYRLYFQQHLSEA